MYFLILVAVLFAVFCIVLVVYFYLPEDATISELHQRFTRWRRTHICKECHGHTEKGHTYYIYHAKWCMTGIRDREEMRQRKATEREYRSL